MRRILAVAMVMVGLMVATACEPPTPEPAMTITAAASPTKPSCSTYSVNIDGTVQPAAATKKVVLQRTVGGKWVDWKWYQTSDSGEDKGTIESQVLLGKFNLSFVKDHWGESLRGTFHLRVRSSGGGRVSNSIYLTFPSC